MWSHSVMEKPHVCGEWVYGANIDVGSDQITSS